MLKHKWLLPVIVIFLVLGMASTALAAECGSTPQDNLPPVRGGRLVYGTLSHLSAMGFSLQTPGGATFHYRVDENTHYHSSVLENPAFENLTVGTKVGVAARHMGAGPGPDAWLARLVVILPDDFDPSQRFGLRVRGEVLAVDLDQETFSLQKRDGEELVFRVDTNTRFLGQVSALADLDTGWLVGVAGEEQQDGVLLAARVAAFLQPRRLVVAGEVQSVDPEDSTFMVHTRREQDLRFNVDDETIFHSRGVVIERLADLQPDMLVLVTGISTEDGDLLARRVAAADLHDLPDFAIKSGGRITAVTQDSLTIQPPEGEALTFQVDAGTDIRDRRLPGASLDSGGMGRLRIGMRVLVGAVEGPDGTDLARLILILQP